MRACFQTRHSGPCSKLDAYVLCRTVRYVGDTDFKEGTWIGVELDVPEGKHNGAVAGRQYFNSRRNHGIFVRPEKVRPMMSSGSNGASQAAVDLTNEVRVRA